MNGLKKTIQSTKYNSDDGGPMRLIQKAVLRFTMQYNRSEMNCEEGGGKADSHRLSRVKLPCCESWRSYRWLPRGCNSRSSSLIQIVNIRQYYLLKIGGLGCLLIEHDRLATSLVAELSGQTAVLLSLCVVRQEHWMHASYLGLQVQGNARFFASEFQVRAFFFVDEQSDEQRPGRKK
jgi:hypothetical protein